MDADDLARGRALLARATPAPWYRQAGYAGIGADVARPDHPLRLAPEEGPNRDGGYPVMVAWVQQGRDRPGDELAGEPAANADLIEWAVNHLTDLLDGAARATRLAELLLRCRPYLAGYRCESEQERNDLTVLERDIHAAIWQQEGDSSVD